MVRLLKFLCIIMLIIFLYSCNTEKDNKVYAFEALEADKTGLNFSNKLTVTQDFNMFKYMYFYNGAGVGAGDFNNDGLVDLFFASNQGQNKLFLNKGGLRFEDITTEANIPDDGGWSTGVSLVDINHDGLLDIYVSRVGNYGKLQSHNQFLICKGINKEGTPFYADEAKQMGLAIASFGTQAAFFDFDNDNDLDIYLMNHSLRFNGSFIDRKTYDNTYDILAGDYLFRNDEGKFTDITRQAGIKGSVIGYGLGICIADMNMDGRPDIYIGNDFHENDYLYINQQNGTFRESLQEATMHTSQFSMGIDVADINNDAFPEIISMDMLPSDPYILKRSLGDDDYDHFNLKIRAGYHPQFARNALQINRRNGYFSEAGMYAGIEATDWSWAALWMDFDNNGWKDLFISNGIPKRMNDMDYVNFLSNLEIQEKIRNNQVGEKDMALIDKFPKVKLPNKFFMNETNSRFQDMAGLIKNDKNTFSNGAVYADFDNDGDLDVVVNNIDEPALLYENKLKSNATDKWIELKLKGPDKNLNAIGAKVVVFQKEQIRTYENFPVRGFQSAMLVPLHIGLGSGVPDSMLLIWPDQRFQRLNLSANKIHSIQYKSGLPLFDYSILTEKNKGISFPIEDLTSASELLFKHEENQFNEFDREQLIPHMVSREGPALAVGDVNKDGLDDIFIGSARNKKSALFIQQSNGKFSKLIQPSLEADSIFEDTDAAFADVNKDGFTDLLIASGGNEDQSESESMTPRVYLNDGKGLLIRKQDAFEKSIKLTASCIEPYDINADGFTDLFIGGRAVPGEYGVMPRSYLLINDGTGKFIDQTLQYNKDLLQPGFVTNATWADLDKDGRKDLLICLEWGGVLAFNNKNNQLLKKAITNDHGWWNFTLAEDIDGDGDLDILAGNLGENNRFKASAKNPVTMYYNDFDENGKKEQVLTYFLGGKEIPFANKDELTKQMPSLKKKFLYAEDFAKADLTEIFGRDKLQQSQKQTVSNFSHALFINNGNWDFELKPLPPMAQLSLYRDAVSVNANDDNLPDFLLVGNFYQSGIQMGMYDADYGTVLVNRGNGNFTAEALNGLVLKGESRHVAPVTVKGKQSYFVVRNNNSPVLFQFIKPARLP